jgi:hypothetical protein
MGKHTWEAQSLSQRITWSVNIICAIVKLHGFNGVWSSIPWIPMVWILTMDEHPTKTGQVMASDPRFWPWHGEQVLNVFSSSTER